MLIELKPMVGLMKTDKDMMKPVVGGDNGDSGRDCWRGNNATSALPRIVLYVVPMWCSLWCPALCSMWCLVWSTRQYSSQDHLWLTLLYKQVVNLASGCPPLHMSPLCWSGKRMKELGKGGATKSDEFSEKFQRGGGHFQSKNLYCRFLEL